MKLRQLTPEESKAVHWWSELIAEAENLTGNPKAASNPKSYAKRLALKLWKEDRVIPQIVQEWRLVSAQGRLDEPLWYSAPSLKPHVASLRIA
jgi:hypothetical protein